MPLSPSAPSGLRPLGDELGKLTKVTQPATADHAPPETTFGYDENRNKTRQTNARGYATTYAYDKLNRLKTMTEPAVAPAGALVTSFTYDPNGNATVVTDPKGQTETSTFDELNRKTTTLYATAPSTPSVAWREVRRTEYDYDENNNPKEAREFISSGTDPPIPRTIARTFDTLDREESETTALPDGGTKTVGYEYFQNGTRRTLIDAAGLRTAYTYDGKNRVATATTESATAQEKSTTYTYYADDLLKDTLDPNGVKASRIYDKADRLVVLENVIARSPANGGDEAISRYEYQYDPNGNRTSQVETNLSPTVPPAQPSVRAPETTTYTYDEANRLKSVTYPADATYPFGRLVTYHYDKAGNREREVETVPATATQNAGAQIIERTGTFDANNRLTALTASVAPPTTPPSIILPAPTAQAGTQPDLASYTFTYDANGNEASRTRTPSPGGSVPEPVEGTAITTLSTWDLKDHLVEQRRSADPEHVEGSILARHEYDADGRRTKKIGEEGIRQYVYDDTSLLAEYDTNGN
ncbi:MAG: hypothetical protein ABI672_14020, partial [Vicinamibacteria bacterium]